MRVCLLFAESDKSTKVEKLASSLAKGLEMNGYLVTLIDVEKEVPKSLAQYNYIVVLTSSISFFSKNIPSSIEKFLVQSSSLGGRRSSAFIINKGLRKQKTLLTLMKIMEKQGMFITYSEIITNESFALEVGKRIKIS